MINLTSKKTFDTGDKLQVAQMVKVQGLSILLVCQTQSLEKVLSGVGEGILRLNIKRAAADVAQLKNCAGTQARS